MDYHQNARLTIQSRARLARKVVERGETVKSAAAEFQVSEKTVAKWARRYRAEVWLGCKTAVRARTARRAEPLPPYWKRFWLFAGCATMAGVSPSPSA